MKRTAVLLVSVVIPLQVAMAQPPPGAPPPVIQIAAPNPPPPKAEIPKSDPRFDLDFPGGTPRELVVAIEKSSGRPLNAIIPEEHVNLTLPPLKMSSVTVPQLFEALRQASIKRVKQVTTAYFGGASPYEQYQMFETSYGFQTRDSGPDAVWYFVYNKPEDPPKPIKVCRFFKLSDDLEKYKIEDITTVIQTGWTLLGITNQPTLKFHPETKVLIAAGEAAPLDMIDRFLAELRGAQGGGAMGGLPPGAPPAMTPRAVPGAKR